MPNNGPKKAAKISIIRKIPIWLKKDNQKTPTTKLKQQMIKLELLKESDDGAKLIKVYWEDIKLAIKLVDAEATIIKINARLVISKLSNFPIISVGFVSTLDKFSGFLFKKVSAPETINSAIKEKIIKFNIKDRFPFLSSLLLFKYREKSP